MTKPILVTSYIDPDLDGSACAVAYAEFLNKTGSKAVAGIIGKLHIEAQFVFEKVGVVPLYLADAHEYDRIALVDTSNLTMFEGRLDPKYVVEVIDHRDVHQAHEFPNAKIQIEKVGAAATLIAERFMYERVPISKESAVLLYAAIASNTLNFRIARTTERDKAAFAWCGEQGNVAQDFIQKMFKAKSDLSGARLKEVLWGDYAWHTLGGTTVVIAQLETLGSRALTEARTGEILSELEKIRNAKTADIVFLNVIDLEEDMSVLVTDDKETQALLSKLFALSFDSAIARHNGLLARKDIWVQLRKELQK